MGLSKDSVIKMTHDEIKELIQGSFAEMLTVTSVGELNDGRGWVIYARLIGPEFTVSVGANAYFRVAELRPHDQKAILIITNKQAESLKKSVTVDQ